MRVGACHYHRFTEIRVIVASHAFDPPGMKVRASR
jgi:hypothetical protein